MAKQHFSVRICEGGGFCLHWFDRREGDSLQGWYRTQDEYEATVRALVDAGYVATPVLR